MHTQQQQWHLWRSAVEQPEIDRALVGLYRAIDDQVRQRGPVCWASGRCCQFDTFNQGDGHRLYVTGLEIAWVLRQLSVPAVGQAVRNITATDVDLKGACSYQVDSMCSIHTVRPMGCRVFFCQRGTQTWQNELYEKMLGELKQWHQTWGVPYQYMEWRTGLHEALSYLDPAPDTP